MKPIVSIQRKTCRAEQRISNDRKSFFFFPLVTHVVVEGSSRSSETGKETAWLENVQRLAGSCLDGGGGFGGNRNGVRARRKRKDASARERVKETRRFPEGILFTLATSNRTVAVDPLKNGFTTCCWQSHLKIPLDIERISERRATLHLRRSAPVSQYLVNIKVQISSGRPPAREGESREDACVSAAFRFFSLRFLIFNNCFQFK